MKYVPSRHAVKHYQVDKRTLWKWCERGLLDFTTTPGGQRRYAIPGTTEDCAHPGVQGSRVSYCYCRVSSVKQKDDLARQEAAMRAEFPNHTIISDIGSGLNFKRRGLQTILERALRREVQDVVVAHRDRLSRFATELIEWLLRACGANIVVQHPAMEAPEADLADDILAIITVFACRSHGRRRYKATAAKKDAKV